MLLRLLPYKDPARLVYACADLKKRNVYDYFWSTPDYLDLKSHASETIEDAAGIQTFRGIVPHDDGTPEDVVFANVTPNTFRVLGARVVLGRDFDDNDGLPQSSRRQWRAAATSAQRLPTITIISQEYFQRRPRRQPRNPGASGRGKNGPVVVGVLERGVELLFRSR